MGRAVDVSNVREVGRVLEPHHDHSVDTLAVLPLGAWKNSVTFVLAVDSTGAKVLVYQGGDLPEQPHYFGVATHNQHLTVVYPPQHFTKESFEAMLSSWELAGTIVSRRQVLSCQEILSRAA